MAKGKASKINKKAEKKAAEPIEDINENSGEEEFYEDDSDPLEWSGEDDIEDSEDDDDISEDDSDISDDDSEGEEEDDDDEDDGEEEEDSELDSESETESESEDSENEVDLTDALMDTKLSDNEEDEDEDIIPKKAIQNGTKPSANEDDLDDLKAKKSSGGGFQTMGLIPPLLNAILKKGFKVPTPIQRKCIPLIMDGVDVVGMARTGSGKTAAFAIPLIDKLKLHSAKVGVRGIILSPNRELALQTTKVVVELSKFTDLRVVSIVGGEKLEDQFSLLTGNPDIIVATPGRLLHLLVETSMELSRVEYIVFDECDRLFEMGFSVQLNEILAKLPTKRQTLLFSATLPKNLIEFAKAGLQDPTLVRLDADTKISSDLELGFFYTKPDYKEAALLYLLRTVVKCPMKHEVDHLRVQPKKNEIGAKKKNKKNDLPPLYNKQAIIFACTKHHVEYLADLLDKAGYEVGYLYGSLDQTARQIQINRFRQQQVAFFVVTDVAARGIDIPVLDYVINYDFVDSSKVFVHRVGRVARAGKRGWAYSLVTPDELPYFLDLQLFLGRPLVTGAQLLRTEATPSYNSDLVIGNLGTENSMDVDIEWVNNRLDKDVTLEGLKGVAQNGYKMFRKSRAQLTAAKPSVSRAKELIKTGELQPIHPLVRAVVPQESVERENFLQSLSKFRPSETIFEIGARGTKKTTAGSIIMQTRRAILTSTINDFKNKNEERIAKLHETDRANLRSTANVDETDEAALESAFSNIYQPSKKSTRNTAKDDKHYIGYVQKDANTEKGYSLSSGTSFAEQTQHAYVDFKSDDKDDLNKQARNQLRWDSKKKKFVRGTGIGSDNKKLITTESGAKLPASFKSGSYQEWQQKTRTKMPRVGEVELEGGAEALENMRQKRKFKHHSTTPAKSDGPKSKRSKSELKSVDQIVKDRKLKEQRREKTGRHKGSKYVAQDQPKGGKGGFNKGGKQGGKQGGNKSFGGNKGGKNFGGSFGGSSKPKGKGQNQGKFKGKVKRKF